MSKYIPRLIELLSKDDVMAAHLANLCENCDKGVGWLTCPNKKTCPIGSTKNLQSLIAELKETQKSAKAKENPSSDERKMT